MILHTSYLACWWATLWARICRKTCPPYFRVQLTPSECRLDRFGSISHETHALKLSDPLHFELRPGQLWAVLIVRNALLPHAPSMEIPYLNKRRARLWADTARLYQFNLRDHLARRNQEDPRPLDREWRYLAAHSRIPQKCIAADPVLKDLWRRRAA